MIVMRNAKVGKCPNLEMMDNICAIYCMRRDMQMKSCVILGSSFVMSILFGIEKSGNG